MTKELERIRRVSDMLTSMYASLRDTYAAWACALDVTILFFSAWTCALAFADQTLVRKFTLPYISSEAAIGILAVCTFILSLVQLRVDWKERSSRFATGANVYAGLKLAAADLLSSSSLDDVAAGELARRYRWEGGVQEPVPNHVFAKLKRAHQLKVLTSAQLDKTPGIPIWMIRAGIFFVSAKTCIRPRR